MAPLASLLLGAFAAASLVTAAVSPITRVGNKLYDGTGRRFFIKGLAYQQPGAIAADTVANTANGGFPEPSSYIDPLADINSCSRDIPNFIALGINVVHVYSLNPANNHAACFNALNNAGLYVIADLGLPLNGSINRADPSWDTGLLNQYLTTLNTILPYPNLLAVTIGNEVVTQASNAAAAPFVKAAARDVKSYLRARGSNVLVSYHSTDVVTVSLLLADYLACGSADTSIDIFGLNNYQFCGNDTYTGSGYDVLTTQFTNYPVVSIFSEFGCISAPRLWTDVPLIYSAPMTNVWSGAIAFEYFADSLGYGLTVNTTSMDGPITTNSQFGLLAAQYRAVTPPVSTNSTAVASVYPSCAASASSLVVTTTLPPTPDQTICSCLGTTALSCITRPSANAVTVGALLDVACSLLSTQGGSCDPIAANGATGVYGSVSYCSAEDKLSYVATMYYERTGAQAGSCSFSGNTTVNAAAPRSAAGVNSSIATCIAQLPATGTFVPSLVSTRPASATGTNSAATGGSSSTPGSSSATRAMGSGGLNPVLACVGVATIVLGALGAVLV